MDRYSVESLVAATAPQPREGAVFEVEAGRFLEAHLDGQLWIKTGAMVAYTGNVTYTREGMLDHGIGRLFKKAITGEGMRLTKAEGRGTLYLANRGKKVLLLHLTDDAICINGNDVLAFEPCLKWDITMLRSVAGMMAGGLFNVRLEGTGTVAFGCHYDPITLPVRPGQPVFTDPNATVAWSAGLTPTFKSDVSLKTFFGRGSGESFQMRFEGDGFVVIQPFEERATDPKG
jgi:uncharacterized protein (AIM24 family)